MESIWKVVEAKIDTRLRASVCLHGVLHGFHKGMGMGMVILELNLSQELNIMDQDPLLLVFLDLHKAYATVEHVRLLTIM